MNKGNKVVDSVSIDQDQEKPLVTGRFRRAFQLGKLGASVTGSYFKDQLKQKLSNRGDVSGISALHTAAKQNAAEMVEVMGRLKGAAMKLGQMLSADPDLIDPAFADQLSKLQSQAPPVPFSQIQQAVEERLQSPLHETFRFFDPKPLGAASIGQVHYAILNDGREVAVKVQYPGIKDSLDSDLKNIRTLLGLGRVVLDAERIDGFMDELGAALRQEVDYAAEAQNLLRFSTLLGHFKRIRIPKPYLEMCTPELLIMEYIEGVPFHQGCQALTDQTDRIELVALFIEVFIYMFHDVHQLHIDPHPGNFLLDQDGNLVILDFGCIRDFDARISDEVLKALTLFWVGNGEEQLQQLINMGFGGGKEQLPSPEAIAHHHSLILAPMASYEPFNFFEWKVQQELRDFLSEHFQFINLAPPPELVMYLRVMAGIKGTLSQIDAPLDIRSVAEAACRRRGLWPPPDDLWGLRQKI